MPLETGILDIESNLDIGWYTPEQAEEELKAYLSANASASVAEKTAATTTLNRVRAKITEALRGTTETSSVQLESFRRSSLKDLIHDWYTLDIEKQGEGREGLRKVILEKIDGLRQVFITHGLAQTPPVIEAESLFRWQNFKDLCVQIFALIDYGVIRGDTQNVAEFTAKHKEILESAGKPGAMTWNGRFNENPLVSSIGIDEGEQFSPTMGLIQRMAYVVFQEMKKPLPAVITAAHKDGQLTESAYSRNQGFSSGIDTEMIDRIAGWNTHRRLDGTLVSVRIRDEIQKYPPDAQLVIKDVARWKAARDDLGSKAGVWHLGFNKGAFKYADGAEGRPAGLIASILYQVGKNSARENHASCLHFIDISDCDSMTKGRPALSGDRGNYKKWSDIRNREVIRYGQELQQFILWRNQKWEKVGYQRYKPSSWYEDFPALDVFFNQSPNAISAPNYTKARDAVLRMVEMSAEAHQTLLSTNTEQLQEKVAVLVKNFNSEIGKAMSLIGQHEVGNRYNYVHRLILACFQYFLASIIMAVPGSVGWFGDKVGIRGLTNREYEELLDVTVRKIREVINLNSTLAGYYWSNTTGKISDTNLGSGGLIDSPFLRREWRHNNRTTQRLQQWRLDNSPELDGMSTVKQASLLNTTPKHSLNVGDGWKSSYEDPEAQRT